jgi:hypothetical protein
MTSPSLGDSVGLALVSVAVGVVEVWEDPYRVVRRDGDTGGFGVLGPGVAGLLGLPGPCLTPSKLMIPR